MSKCKIFISCHNRQKVIKTGIIETVQVGRANSKEKFEGMIGDDTGLNISKENPRYNELTCQYWAWKNYEAAGNPDYIGFMHYRRHFVFNEKLDYKNGHPWFPEMYIYFVPNLSDEFLDNLSDKYVNALIDENYDCYVLKPYDINYMHNNDLYMKEHYILTIWGSKRYIWNTFYDVIKRLYPDYADLLDEFTFGHKMILCNMFIMKKDLFNEYSSFCFNVLNEVDSNINSKDFSSSEKRFLGFLGEYLLSIFVMKLQKDNCKIKYLDGLLFNNMETGKNRKRNFLENIFSIRNDNDGKHKVLSFLFIRFKIKYKPSEIASIKKQLKKQEEMTKILLEKVTELQEEIILKGKR